MMMSRLMASVLALAAGLLSWPSILAGQSGSRNHLHDKFQGSAALSFVRFTTSIRVDTEGGSGSDLDVEDDLGAPSTVVEPRLGLRWNMSRRHSLEFGYQFARRGGERTVTEEFEYQGETYEAGLTIRSKFNSDLASLTWRWAFHSSDKSRIGATLGVGALLFKTGIDGYASVNDQTAEVSAARNLTAPVAGLGAFGQWRLGEAWYLELDLRALYIPVARFEVLVGDINSGLRWWPSTWAGFELGLGVNSVKVDVNEDPEAVLSGAAQIKYRLAHPRLAFLIAF